VPADDPLIRKIVGEARIEAVEGFWIPRPWLLDAACPLGQAPIPTEPQESPGPKKVAGSDEPRSTAEPSAPAPDWPRIGLVQFYMEGDSRTGRRDRRAYEAVKTLDGQSPVGAQGFNLVLSGRLEALSGRPVIQCDAASPDSPPDCVVSAEFDRVWIESPDGKSIIAQWSHG
jgi:hypothetical protein